MQEVKLVNEKPLLMNCNGAQLLGILHSPNAPATRAVLLIVGGPQYRVGSHRQFVLLARSLAKAGIACLRFDYRSMGDSEGDWRDFSAVNDDISVAMNTLHNELPSLESTALWGLCDAASAALIYAPQDKRVSQLVLLNPWVRSQAGLAKTYLKNYYLQRLTSPELWKKVASGKFNVGGSASSLLELVGLKKAAPANQSDAKAETKAISATPPAMDPDFLAKMLGGWQSFSGEILLLLSGKDFVADEFQGLLKSNKMWQQCVADASTERHDFPDCDHTFSSSADRIQVENRCIQWLLAR